MQVLLGIIFHFIGGFASGSFYIPYKKVNNSMFFSAFVTAIFYFVPNLFPFFSPGEWPVAMHTNLGGQICFFYSFHGCV